MQRLALSQGRFIVALLSSICNDKTESLDADTTNALFLDLYAPASFDVHLTKKSARGCMPYARRSNPDPVGIDCDMGGLLAAILIHGTKLQLPDVDKILLQQLKAGADETPAEQFEMIYLPFARELLSEYGRREVDDNIRSTIATMITEVLVALVTKHVPKQPTLSADWTRPGVSCSCHDCTDLNAFLRSPTARVGRFPMGKRRRQHLHQKLDGSRQQCTHETERRGNPQPLVVTKIDISALAESAWKTRAQMLAINLRELRQDHLKQALGEEYERVLNLWDVVVDWSRAPTCLQRPPLRALQQNVGAASGQTGVQTKRKAENEIETQSVPKRRAPVVIDLCDSD